MLFSKLVLAIALASQTLAPADYGSGVFTTEYTLGDDALHVPGFTTEDGSKLQDIELTAAVYAPKNLGAGKHPLVVMMHGYWPTCADRKATDENLAAQKLLNGPNATKDPAVRDQAQATVERTGAFMDAWPCVPGTPPLPSYRGYDYLGQELARHGIIAVSVGANGVNAGNMDEMPANRARAAVINKHLEMWQRLSSTGTGPLAPLLGTRFRGHVDMNDVGTVGHSRAGRGVMYQAADVNRNQWPVGVTVKAVVPLAAASYFAADPEAPENELFRVTRIPFELFIGGCDDTANPAARVYFDNVAGRNKERVSEVDVEGANHNFLNRQWSPSSGQVGAHDDVERGVELGYGDPRPQPGHCANVKTKADEKQLTEPEERAVSSLYVTSFLRRYLNGETQLDPLLTGKQSTPGVTIRTQ